MSAGDDVIRLDNAHRAAEQIEQQLLRVQRDKATLVRCDTKHEFSSNYDCKTTATEKRAKHQVAKRTLAVSNKQRTNLRASGLNEQALHKYHTEVGEPKHDGTTCTASAGTRPVAI